MGCSASKASEVIVPMPEKTKDNLESPKKQETGKDNLITAPRKSSGRNTKRKVIQVKESNDSLRGSQSSLNSQSEDSRSERENSAKSTRTTDSGMGELEDEEIITENSNPGNYVNERPPTPGWFRAMLCLFLVLGKLLNNIV